MSLLKVNNCPVYNAKEWEPVFIVSQKIGQHDLFAHVGWYGHCLPF